MALSPKNQRRVEEAKKKVKQAPSTAAADVEDINSARKQIRKEAAAREKAVTDEDRELQDNAGAERTKQASKKPATGLGAWFRAHGGFIVVFLLGCVATGAICVAIVFRPPSAATQPASTTAPVVVPDDLKPKPFQLPTTKGEPK